MNNYSNMNYYVPNTNNLIYQNKMLDNNYLFNNQAINNNRMANVSNYNQNLAKKLQSQVGNNMNFNECDFQGKVSPNDLYDVYGGFIRGNMFKQLYSQYKVNKPFEVEPLNKQAELLTYIDAYSFATHDLNLYLDNYPDDANMIELFKEYTKQKEQIISEYEQKYGPIFTSSSTTVPWAWNNSPWPWEN